MKQNTSNAAMSSAIFAAAIAGPMPSSDLVVDPSDHLVRIVVNCSAAAPAASPPDNQSPMRWITLRVLASAVYLLMV